MMSPVEHHQGLQSRVETGPGSCADPGAVDRLLADLMRLRETVFEMERRGDPPDQAEETLRRVLGDAAQLVLE